MAENNVDTLESRIIVDNKGVADSFKNTAKEASNLADKIKQFKKITGIKEIGKHAKESTPPIKSLGNVLNSLKSALNITALVYGFKRLVNVLWNCTENSVKLSETMNLFEVSMGKTLDEYGNLDVASSQYYSKALKFQNQLNEAFGTNIEETMKYQALYNQMAKSMGIDNGSSYTMSENLTKLGIDLASLFNKDESTTMETLRAGVMAGQTKPLRNYGLDVTQQTLAPTLKELGINRSVKQLSQAEKMVLRYIAVLKQASSAHGDFAKTIESPANQTKVFRQQLEELKTTAGNLFQGLLGQVLPYANAILMVAKEILKAFGMVMGVNVTSNSTNLASTMGIDDLDSGLASATDNAKKLKAQIMGFDEINNITEDTNNNSDSVNSNGIDSRLLDGLSGYDNLMGNVQMKATSIRDSILDWLGFTKKINPLTGEINWILKDGWTNLKKIKSVLGVIAGLYVVNKVKKVTDAVQALIKKFPEFKNSISANCIKTLVGATGLIVSFNMSHSAMSDFEDGLISSADASKKLAGSIGIGAGSGALIGSMFGLQGAIIGGLLGALGSVVSGFIGIYDEAGRFKKEIDESSSIIQKNVDTWKSYRDNIQINMDAELSQVESIKILVDELGNLVDANGKVKDGYKDRAEFILNQVNSAFGTEYEMIDGTIKGYQNIKNSIYDVIKAKQEEIVLNANEELYSEAIKNRTQAYKDYTSAINSQKTAYRELNDKLSQYGLTMEDLTTKSSKYYSITAIMGIAEQSNLYDLMKAYETSSKTAEDATRVWKETNKTIINYENLKTATLVGDQKAIDKAIKDLTNTYKTEAGVQTLSISEQLDMQRQIYSQTKDSIIQSGKELTAENEKSLKTAYDNVIQTLINETKAVEELTPEQAKAWENLAKNDKESFNTALSGLEQDTKDLVTKTINSSAIEIKNGIPTLERASQEIGSSTGTAFRTALKSLGTTKLSDLLNNDTNAYGMGKNLGKDLGNGMTDGFNTIFSLGKLHVTTQGFKFYANGGMPERGEMFVANEAGPELVGKIGNRSAVANSNQIISGIAQGVYSAVVDANSVSSNSGSVQLSGKINGKELLQIMIDGINGIKKQTGECPIEVY